MTVSFKAAAKIEYLEAIIRYESEPAGLGQEFRAEVNAALKKAQQHPELYPRVHRTSRKIRLRRFWRYAIYFSINEGIVTVIAVFHSSRDPHDLKGRFR